MDKNLTICKTNASSYDMDIVEKVIETHFSLMGYEEILKPEMKVLIKPNLLMKRIPEQFTTTHPVVVGAVIKKLQSLGITDITLADSPGGPYLKNYLKSIYTASGMEKISEDYKINLNYDVGYKSMKIENSKIVSEFSVINPVFEADIIINICKLKTHAMTGMSGAVKNLFGTVPGLLKPEFHFRFPDKRNFSEMLVDLSTGIKPAINFVDAIESMEGDGPSGGEKRSTNLIVSAYNIYNLDLVLCEMIGFTPEEIFTVKAAIDRGLCEDNTSKLNIIGDCQNQSIKDFKKPKSHTISFSSNKGLSKFLEKIASPKPLIIKNVCIGCGKCKESCPADTIDIKDKKAVIRYVDCIKCFCCHEMCPVRAIKIKRNNLFNF